VLQLYSATNDNAPSQQIGAFEISKLITFSEYKTNLNAVQKNSSETFYLSQWPDSSIASPDAYITCVTKPAFDASPVLGISRDNAMNFNSEKACRGQFILVPTQQSQTALLMQLLRL
jgi:hypothetical protein